MRVAVFANPTIGNIMGASDYVEFREACQYIVAKYPDAFFYFCLPSRVKDKVTDKIERTHFMFYEQNGFLFYDGQADAPAGFVEMFHSRIGKFPIDAVWTTRTTAGATLGRRLQDHRTPDGSIPIIIEEFKPANLDEPAQTINESDLIVNSMSYLLSWNMFDTHHCHDLAIDTARRYLSGTALEEMEKRSAVIHCGVNFDYIEKFTKNQKKNHEFTVLFGGRINILKRTDLVFECIDEFQKFGRKVRGVICTPTLPKSQAVALEAEFPLFEFNWSVSKSEFLGRAATAHAFVNASTNEGFSVGIVEQLYLGLVGVLPARPWVRGLLMEHYDSYPFIFNDRTEMAAKLRWIHDNYAEAQEALRPIQAMIRERYSRKEASHKTWDFIVDVVEKQAGTVHERIGGDTRKLFGATTLLMPPKFSLQQFCKAVADRSEVMRESDFDAPNRGRPSKWMAYKWLLASGFKDLLDSQQPWFERKG